MYPPHPTGAEIPDPPGAVWNHTWQMTTGYRLKLDHQSIIHGVRQVGIWLCDYHVILQLKVEILSSKGILTSPGSYWVSKRERDVHPFWCLQWLPSTSHFLFRKKRKQGDSNRTNPDSCRGSATFVLISRTQSRLEYYSWISSRTSAIFISYHNL